MFIDFLDRLPKPLRYAVFYGLFAIGIFTKPAHALIILAILFVSALISPKKWLAPWGLEPIERKRVLKIYGIPLIFFFTVALGLSPAPPATHQTNQISSPPSASAKSERTVLSPQKRPTAKRLDTKGTASNVTFQISGLVIQQSLGNRETQDLFVIPSVTINNNQNDAIRLDLSLFTLIDEKGREFSPLNSFETYMMNENNKLQENLNPGLTAQIAIPFEVPRNVKALSLQCRGGITGSTVTLRIDPPTNAENTPKRSPAIGLMAKLKNDENAYRVTTPGANPAFTLKAGDVVQIIGEDTRGMYYEIQWKNEHGFVKRSALQLFAN